MKEQNTPVFSARSALILWTIGCLLAAVFSPLANAQDEVQLQGERADLKPFLGIWEGKWDSVWSMRIAVREGAGGKVHVAYEYKEFITDDDYISVPVTTVELRDKETLRINDVLFLYVPTDAKDGKTMLAAMYIGRGVMRSVVKRAD